jgi:hypothetical protein
MELEFPTHREPRTPDLHLKPSRFEIAVQQLGDPDPLVVAERTRARHLLARVADQAS